jgi:DNA-binding Xre family transcriptional regulator
MYIKKGTTSNKFQTKLSKIRFKKGLTQKKAAEICGISYDNYCQMETHPRRMQTISIPMLTKLLTGLECGILDIVEFEDKKDWMKIQSAEVKDLEEAGILDNEKEN